MKFNKIIVCIGIFVLLDVALSFACTTITVGKKASVDGSVMTSHTCDGHEGRTWIGVVPHRSYKSGAMGAIHKGTDNQLSPTDFTGVNVLGKIPQPRETFGYLYGIYGLMNEHQLAIGESTFDGREELRNEKALLDCCELTRLVMERARTAREAIRLIDELTKRYGYNDKGECLTIADKDEVWHLEILGCGEDRVGAVWAAQRIPDDHVGVCANGSRIRQLDLSDPDQFMASENVFSLAEEMGWWDPQGGEAFQFCYVYADRRSMAARRREWRVFDLLAPSLKLDPNGENFPFSIKPDSLVSVQKIMEIFRDTFEGTPFDMTKFMLVPDDSGRAVKSPYADPFINYEAMPLFKISGGWHEPGGRGWEELGERCLARWYCIYVTVTQSRCWLPDPIGGLVWLGYANPAMTAYAPFYNCVTRLPQSYRINGRPGYNQDCAWWAFERVACLAKRIWGHMRVDVDSVRSQIEKQGFEDQPEIESQAAALYKKSPKRAIKLLTNYTNEYCDRIVKAYWNLGDHLWSKYYDKM